MSQPIIQLQDAIKEFRRGDTSVRAVNGVSLSVHPGEFLAIMGKSGSGKSTLLHVMSGLLKATAGTVRLFGQDIGALADDPLTLLRRQKIGFIFQFFNLLPTLTAAENVALPLLLAKARPAAARARAGELLELVGLGDRGHHKPDELSGGQMQRVAIARALVNDPPLLFADEPTGNLDSVSSEEIMALVKDMQATRSQTIVMVTHDAKAAGYGDRLITMRDGRVLEDVRVGGGTAGGVVGGGAR